MIDEEARLAAVTLILATGVLIASQTLRPWGGTEQFSELGVLGPEMEIGDYPMSVHVNESFRLHLYLGNHEGRVMYYVTLIKLGEKSTSIDERNPAEGEVIAEYETILPHGHSETIPLDLTIPKPTENSKLIFELWILEEGRLRYHGRWLQLWINVTAPKTP